MPRAKCARRLLIQLRVENNELAAMTDAGADLLEQIAASGSLSEAARQLRFSYRRAWVLVDSMNKRWPRPLVETTIGGSGGGGAILTELGSQVLRTYRDLQLRLEHILDLAGDPFAPFA